MTEDKVKSALT